LRTIAFFFALRQMRMTRILNQTQPEPLKKGAASCPARSENLTGLIDNLRFMNSEV
jgi:hypothetical protein